MKGRPTQVLSVGFTLALAVLGTVAWLNLRHTQLVQESARWIAHAHQVRYELSELFSVVQDIEAGARSYVLTGSPAFLQPYEAALKAEAAKLRLLRELTVDNPGQQRVLDALEPLIARRLESSAEAVRLRRDAGFAAAQAEVASGRGKGLMDDVRAGIAVMDTVEAELLEERAAVMQREADFVRALTVGGTSLSLGLFVAVFALMLRENRRRLRSEAELDRFFSLSLDMLGVAHADGYFKRISPAFTQTLGWSVEEMLARPFLDFIHPDDRAASLAALEQLVVRGENLLQFENRYAHKDGSWRVLSWKAAPQPGGLMYCTARDITERKHIEEQMVGNLKVLAEFKTALDQHAIVAITDARGKITYVNDKFCAISRYPRAELLGQDHRIINSSHHPKEFIRDLWQTITRGSVWQGEIKNRAKDGTFYWVDTTIVPFLGADGKPAQFIAIRADITARKQAEERIGSLNADLLNHARLLEEANQELASFSYSVSHDLRSPLRGIDGFCQALEEDYADKLDEPGRGHLARVRAAAKRMSGLIDDLLRLARLTRAELHRQPVDLSRLARTVAAELHQREPRRQVAWAIADELLTEGDPQLLRVALENLFSNAWKFTGQRPDARIEFGRLPPDGPPAFFVRDNGAGFDMAHAKKLFGAFQRLHTQTEFEGTGIGLATVQRIVHRHGGRVWAEGAVNRGATFYFTL